MIVRGYDDFVTALMEAGFSMAGGKDGIFSVITWGWCDKAPYDTPVRWHTGDIETDPWQWRERVLNERSDIAYAKLFFGKSGYITREWYPYFLAARRDGAEFADAYADGVFSYEAKRVYECVSAQDSVPVHLLKQQCGFGKEEKSAFERALTNLQAGLYITTCGWQQKVSQKGEEYGWQSAVYCTTERFWGDDVFDEAAELSPEEAAEAIRERILLLNPDAESKRVNKFIKG